MEEALHAGCCVEFGRRERSVYNIIEVQNLTKIYRQGRRRVESVLAVDHIDFSVRRGEVFGFLGPNGAGKTTTHRMLTTLLTPTEGTVHIAGQDIRRHAHEAKKSMGLVPEEANVYTELNAWDNLMFTGSLYRVSQEERKGRAQHLLEVFGLWDRRMDKTEEFSRGMRRRLCIAMALIHQPTLLFLDEPTSGLDAQSARLIRDLVREMNAEGTTVFLTTHQIEEANRLCDRVAIIHHGRIAAVDTPERLKRDFRQVQSVEVALEPLPPAAAQDLSRLPGVGHIVKRGDKWRLYTEDPSRMLPRVVHFAEQRGLTIVSLNTLGPSLEDVFLQITGQEVGTTTAQPRETGKRRGKRA
jgi:ABC-2 type transport system ATP-binding protein